MNTQTPITDDITRQPCGTVRKYGLMIDHARKLETDRAALIAALADASDALRVSLNNFKGQHGALTIIQDASDAARATLAAVQS